VPAKDGGEPWFVEAFLGEGDHGVVEGVVRAK
jgi:hypothetical protein